MTKDEQVKQAMEILYTWTKSLCEYAGETPQVAEEFWSELTENTEILQEYAYYFDNGEFLCQYKVENLSIADILIWQMDHFRFHMDRPDIDTRFNKDKLVYQSFRTMLEMKKAPEKLLEQFRNETGTDMVY